MGKLKVSFYTQGCRLNQAETAQMEQSMDGETFLVVDFKCPADITVINTCTVTENGDSDTRKLVHKINRLNPDCKIALVGCQAQILKEKLADMHNVLWVIGNGSKMSLVEIIKDTKDKLEPTVLVNKIKAESFTIKTAGIDRKHTRANLKIQDGCDFYCAFCIIPFARGPARSRVFSDILDEAKILIKAGHRELVITGVNIGTYSYEGKTFLDVINALDGLDGLDRIRISSIEPTTIPSDLFEMMNGESKLCKYLHIPIQSGTDEVLTLMNRKYALSEFMAFVERVRSKVPDICIGTDVIVGFPGETDSLFEQTEMCLREGPFDYFHVFSYSERKMARSKRFEGQVSVPDIKKRSDVLRSLSKRKKALYTARFVGKTVPVLMEQKKRGAWTGLTEHYIRVNVSSEVDLTNQIVPVVLKKASATHAEGVLLEMVGQEKV
jgi:threonylcarbamoyladenosine tRNA methylthiotransferase MtaB